MPDFDRNAAVFFQLSSRRILFLVFPRAVSWGLHGGRWRVERQHGRRGKAESYFGPIPLRLLNLAQMIFDPALKLRQDIFAITDNIFACEFYGFFIDLESTDFKLKSISI